MTLNSRRARLHASYAVSNLLLYAIPGFLLSLWLERWWAARGRGTRAIRGYETRDTLANLAMGMGNVIISAFSTPGAVLLWQLAYRHRILDSTRLGAWSWPILFLGEDLCYYFFHRAHHEVRVLWAAHVSHHSSQYFNLSTALRPQSTLHRRARMAGFGARSTACSLSARGLAVRLLCPRLEPRRIQPDGQRAAAEGAKRASKLREKLVSPPKRSAPVSASYCI